MDGSVAQLVLWLVSASALVVLVVYAHSVSSAAPRRPPEKPPVEPPPHRLTLTFGRTRSARLEEAVKLALALPGYRLVDPDGDPLHLVDLSPAEASEQGDDVIALWRLVKAWKGTVVQVDGELVSATEFAQWLPGGSRSPLVCGPNVETGWISEVGWGEWEDAPCRLVVGTSHYQDAMRRMVGQRGGCLMPVAVTLVRDPHNPHDANAVRAEVRGEQVGFVAARVAARLAPLMDSHGVAWMAVAGMLRGGETRDGIRQNIGCLLFPGRRLTRGIDLRRVEGCDDWAYWPPGKDELRRYQWSREDEVPRPAYSSGLFARIL